MTKPFTEQIFRTSYKDDYRDSDNYHRILFNSGRALQARELTQLQTIIQKEIERFGSNIFKDGSPITPGGVRTYNEFEFIKLSGNPLPSDKTTLNNAIFTGATSGVSFKVLLALGAENSDPDTLYVQYLSGDNTDGLTTVTRATPGEDISGTVDGNVVTYEVQTTNTSLNPAIGQGCAFEVGEGSFFVQGHFVYNEKQLILLSKYSRSYTGQVGFRVVQDIVTTADNDALFDNQGVTPNRSSPGADRYRIRLILTRQEDVDSDQNYVTISDVVNGRVITKPTADQGFNSIRDFVALRNKEISGDFIKKYFKAQFLPNDETTFKLRVDPGIAYINGYRVEKKKPSNLVVEKPTSTFTQDNDQILVDYGNYFVVSDAAGGLGMPNFSECEQVNLYSEQGGTGDVIGTTNVRAITEWQNSLYKLHVFNTKITNTAYSTRDVRSIGTGTSLYYNNFSLNNQTLFETKKKKLLFDLPISRPQSLESISLTGQEVFERISNASGVVSISLSGNQNFTNTNDWVIASASDAFLSGYSISLGGSGESVTITGLPSSTPVSIAAYVRNGSAQIRTKTLTETTVTDTLDSDGAGNRFISLGQSDIYQVTRIRKGDSDGENLFTSWVVDTGARDTHYDDGKLLYKGGTLTGSDNVFVRFKYFEHGTGDFFAVNSYTGQVSYRDIPAHQMENGRLVSLRDVLDFRPSTDGSGSASFSAVDVNPLPQPTGLVEADASYYLPRKDKLVLSQTGELRYLQGTPDLQPEFPTTPTDCIDLYKFELNANTLHTKDLKSRLLPMKGYTMADIGKLESKLDKVEEMATLSLLELSTKNLQVLDSVGVDRTKAGFFVDNFANHLYSDTKNIEYRASIDPQKKFLRPSHRDFNIDLYYDSTDTNNIQVTKKGDLIMLDYTETDWITQPTASRTENLNPFYVEKVTGQLELSPASDFWRETEITEPLVLDQGTVLDTKQALLWNSHEWNWSGVDLNELQVGAVVNQNTATNTSVTANTSQPRIVGEEVRVTQGEWVATGTVVDVNTLGSQTEIISQETDEIRTPLSSSFIDWSAEDFPDLGGFGAAGWELLPSQDPILGTQGNLTQIDTVTTTTLETREQVETVSTTTLEQTTTTEVETQWQTDTTYTTTTDTTTTVNRVAGEHTIREVVGSKVVDVLTIPWMRSRVVSFRASGLRPNTRYFPFFDQTLVEPYCKLTSGYVRVSDRSPEFRRTSLTPAVGHSDSAANTALVTDGNGSITGEFELPNNSAMRFATGTKEFALLDISKYNLDDALSRATALYTASGTLDVIQETVHSTRVLEVVGEQTRTSNTSITTQSTLSTSVAADTTIATDVQVETTISENVSQETTTDVTSVTVGQEPQPSFGYTDPLAQTFLVNGGDERNGVFLTKVRVYFATKDSGDIPVRLEIRPTVNGVPSSDAVVPGSKVTKVPAQVIAIEDSISDPTVSQMLANGTDFEFEEPIYLRGATEYAIVLISASMEYKVYISHVTDFELGSTEKRISKQPYLGALFKSQNSRLWEPSQEEDLAFQLYRADFENEGSVFLTNVNTPPLVLGRNPLYSDSGDNTITVFCKNHGLRQGDVTLIDGLDSATTYNGMLGSSLVGQRTVTSVDGTAFQFEADSSANTQGRFGGGKVTALTNMTFETLFPTIQTLKPETTTLTFSGKFLGQSSLADSDAGRFSTDPTFRLIKNYGNYYFDTPKMIANPLEEASEGVQSATIQVNLTTSDTKVSPVIDMQRAGLGLIGNIIDRQKSTVDTTFTFSADSGQTTFTGLDLSGDSLSYGLGDNDYLSVYVSDSADPTYGTLLSGNRYTATDGSSIVFNGSFDSGDVITVESYSLTSSGENIPLSYVRENHPFLGTSLAKHVTIPVELENDAFGLKIILAANRPPEADFDVYYKTAEAEQPLSRIGWFKANPDDVLPSDTNKTVFREYRYTIGGFGDDNNWGGDELPSFRKFQVKIVMRTTNSAKVPVIRDLRCIAVT